MMGKTLYIPFTHSGNMMHYCSSRYPNVAEVSDYLKSMYIEDKWKDIRHGEWRENYEFDATLTIESLNYGRSARNFTLVDENGLEYIMFPTEMIKSLKIGGCKPGGILAGRWTFCKRGSNYGIVMVDG